MFKESKIRFMRGALPLAALAALSISGCAGQPKKTETQTTSYKKTTPPESAPAPVSAKVPTTTLYFTEGSSKLTDADIQMLDEFVEKTKANKETKMLIEGYTDGKGSGKFNDELSEKRAGSVRDYLAFKGISQDRVLIRGMGETVASKDVKEAMPDARKVVIKDATPPGAEAGKAPPQASGHPTAPAQPAQASEQPKPEGTG